jgi:Tfp pilus assembly PilM family ATPase
MNLGVLERPVIGVDMDGRWIRAAQVRGGGAMPTLVAAARVPRLGEGAWTAEEAGYLSEVLLRRGFEPGPLVVAAPREMVVSAALELPPAGSGAPLGQIARLELARVSRVDPTGLVMATWAVPPPVRSPEGTHVMAVGVATEKAESLIGAYADVGLEVEGIDVREWGLVRGVGRVGEGLRCVVDLGWDSTTLVLTHSGTVLFTRVLELAGLKALYGVLETRLGLTAGALDPVLEDPGRPDAAAIVDAMRPTLADFAEALSPEVSRSLAYAEQRCPQAGLNGGTLTGEGAGLPGLAEHLTSQVGSVWRVARPVEVVTLKGSLERVGTDAGLMCALGLSTGAGEVKGVAA